MNVQGRYDGAGSEEIGMMNPLSGEDDREPGRGFAFVAEIDFLGEVPERRPWTEMRKSPGDFCPASFLGLLCFELAWVSSSLLHQNGAQGGSLVQVKMLHPAAACPLPMNRPHRRQ